MFALLIGFAMQQFSHWVDLLMPSLPDWLSFLQYIVWPLFVLLVLVIVFFTFTMVANIISAPFNGFLSEKVEVVVRGRDDFPPFSWAELLAMIPRTMGREMRKLAYFLPRALVLLVLSFVPGVNLIATPLWILFGIWMMAVQYIDYPADNHKLGWNEMLAWLRSKRWACMGFGRGDLPGAADPAGQPGHDARRRRRRHPVLGPRGRREGAGEISMRPVSAVGIVRRASAP